ncbi:hypothetical protein BST81_25565 [Leptolyngbya sp. 'hensonii']|uniref:tetratricopeptide repeat protein n=1 Tax=Leptolyngbya sp. 'hensonii' TaxID=1922337 RepID=UPI00094FA638|nr:tetratricopeptide repeat protein [Leptolyngbya sp. 'hensonii']OLP15579.1 hypothetical protein BST81_25565 [Leptolyngbya sp. 'hensonii']
MSGNLKRFGIVLGLLLGLGLPPLTTQAQLPDPTSERVTNRAMLLRMGNDAYQSGQFTQAEAVFRKILEEYPNDAVIYYKLGNTLYRQKRLEAAIVEYQKAIALNPNYAVAHNALGTTYAIQNRMTEAIASFRQAVQINNTYSEALANLGQALWLDGKPEEAVSFLKKARDLYKEQGKLNELDRVEKLLREIGSKEPTVSRGPAPAGVTQG